MARPRATAAKSTGKPATRVTKRAAPAKAAGKSKAREASLPRAAAKEALDQATVAIGRMQKDASRNTWAIGRRLSQVAELRLYLAGGFATLEDYVEAKLKITRQTAYQYVRVAEAFSEEVAATFGAEKLDRALRYIAATPAEEQPRDIPELRVAVPGEAGEAARTKPFAELTVSELRRATQAVAAAQGGASRGRSKALPEGLAGKLVKANRALDQAVGAKAARGAEIRARATAGEVLIEVRGLPFGRAAAALRGIAAALR